MANYGVLHPKHIFGISAECTGKNLFCLDSKTIAYPAGNAVVLHDLNNKTQQFLHGVEKFRGVTAFTVTNTKVYAAVAQAGDEDTPISIGIFDLIVNKRKKTLVNPDITSKEYVSLSFTADSLNLASLSGAPDYIVYLWKWDKSRLLCQAKTTGLSGPMHVITASPIDHTVFCALGKGTLRFFRHNEGHLKPFGYQKGENLHFLCHAWLGKGERIVVGTSEGSLFFFDKHEFRFDMEVPIIESSTSEMSNAVEATNAILKEINATETLPKKVESSPSIASSTEVSELTGRGVTAAVTYSKGFIIGFGPGHVVVYEEQVSFDIPEDQYKPVYFLRIPAFTTNQNDRTVKTLSLNTTEEILLATTISGQLFQFYLGTIEIKEPDEMEFEFFDSSFHKGAVIGMDVASRKTIFVTIGADKFIRVWNYVTMKQEVAKEFSEEIRSVSFHPSGFFLVAGFADKIRMFAILINDIRELRDFNVRECDIISFSHGGHLFAAVNGNVILIYRAMSYHLVNSLKGHSNKIRNLKWTTDDTRLISVGADGAIYEWDVATGRREADFVEKGSNMTEVGITSDPKIHFAISRNKMLKEIHIQEGILTREVELPAEPTSIAVGIANKVLVVGFSDGVVRTVKQPIGTVNDWYDFRLHYRSVNSVRITFDEGYCVSVSEDGSIMIWKVTDPDGRICKSDKELYFSNEVLVQKTELEERDMAIRELKQRFGELKLEMEYQNKRKEILYHEEIKAIKGKSIQENAKLDSQIEELVDTLKEHDEIFHERVKSMKKDTKDTRLSIQAHYNTRLIDEYEKYNGLQNLLDTTVADYEERLIKLDKDRSAAIDELMTFYDAELKDKTNALQAAYTEARQVAQENEIMRKLIEEHGDDEVEGRKSNYQAKINHERDLNAKFRADANIMRKNFVAMQREIDEQKSEVSRLVNESEKTKTMISLSETEVSTLKKDLVDRDIIVQGKEKTIFDLKKTNNEFEKFKFILDYKIKELKKMLEPKDRTVNLLKQKNTDMEKYLEETIAMRNGLEIQASELSSKLRIVEKECQKEKRSRWQLQILLERIRSGMSRSMGYLQDHESLKNVIQEMHDQYGETKEVVPPRPSEQEAVCELVRQKGYLEMSINSMELKMSEDLKFTRGEQLHVMNENMMLVHEINTLRKELKSEQDTIQQYENSFGVNMAQGSDQAEMKLKLYSSVEDMDEITLEHMKEVEARNDLINTQKVQIKGLRTRIEKVQAFVNGLYDMDEVGPGVSVDVLKQILSDT